MVKSVCVDLSLNCNGCIQHWHLLINDIYNAGNCWTVTSTFQDACPAVIHPTSPLEFSVASNPSTHLIRAQLLPRLVSLCPRPVPSLARSRRLPTSRLMTYPRLREVEDIPQGVHHNHEIPDYAKCYLFGYRSSFHISDCLHDIYSRGLECSTISLSEKEPSLSAACLRKSINSNRHGTSRSARMRSRLEPTAAPFPPPSPPPPPPPPPPPCASPSSQHVPQVRAVSSLLAPSLSNLHRPSPSTPHHPMLFHPTLPSSDTSRAALSQLAQYHNPSSLPANMSQYAIAEAWKTSLHPVPAYDSARHPSELFPAPTQQPLQRPAYPSQSLYDADVFAADPRSHYFNAQPQSSLVDSAPPPHNPPGFPPPFSDFHQTFPVPSAHRHTVIQTACNLAGMHPGFEGSPQNRSGRFTSNSSGLQHTAASHDLEFQMTSRPPLLASPPSARHSSSQSVDCAVAALWPDYQEPSQAYPSASCPGPAAGSCGGSGSRHDGRQDNPSSDLSMDDPFRADFQQAFLSATDAASTDQLTDTSSSAESDANDSKEQAGAGAGSGEPGSKRNRKGEKESASGHSRHWKEEEHERFLMALNRFSPETLASESGGLGPGIAELIAVVVKTRTVSQVRSHAQKFLIRLRKQREAAAQGK
eukprot:764782-Hanusia_phi.AAC.1